MKPKNSPKLITKIIASVVLANFLLINTATAQTPPPATPPPAVELTRADWERAQGSVEACTGASPDSFNSKVTKATLRIFKAVWQEANEFEKLLSSLTDFSGIVQQCYIVEGNFDASTGVYNRAMRALALENRIKSLNTDQKLDSNVIAEETVRLEKELNSYGPITTAIGWVINAVLGAVATFLTMFGMLAGKILDIAIKNAVFISYRDINIVNVGWGVVRDVANMFFILIFIVIALAAILRIEKYDYKHLLPEFIVMAILVNFSKEIAITIIDFSNLIAGIFYGQGLRDIWNLFINVAQPDTILSGTGDNWQTALGNSLGKIIFMLVAVVSFVALALLFVVRLVGLYIFVIFSPFYFILEILPATKEFAHKYQHKFLEYVVWVPVAMLMLRLTMSIAQDNRSSGLFVTGNSAFTFIILAAFIWATILIAEHAGMIGGNFIAHAAEKGLHNIGHGLGHMAGGFVGYRMNKLSSKLALNRDADGNVTEGRFKRLGKKIGFAVLNPRQTSEAWMEKTHEDHHRESAYAHATAREMYRNPQAKDYRRILSQKEEIEKSKEYTDLNVEGMVRMAKRFERGEDHRTAQERRGLLRAAAMQGRVEDIADELAGENERDHVTGQVDVAKFLRRYLQVGHDNESRRFIEQDLTNIGERVNRAELMGHSGDPTHDTNAAAHLEAKQIQAANQATEVGKWEAQLRARSAPQNYGFELSRITDEKGEAIRDEKGNPVVEFLYNPAKAPAMAHFDQDEVREHIARWQSRLTNAAVPGRAEADGTIIVKSKMEYDSMKNLENQGHVQTVLSSYAKKLGAKDIRRTQYNATGFKVVLERADGSREAVGQIGDGGAGMKWDVVTKELSKKPGAGSSTGGSTGGDTKGPSVILTDERGNPVDKGGNPIKV